MRILGLDVGSKTIGVAVSDPMGWTAQGVSTIQRKDMVADAREVERILEEYAVEEIVVGLPLMMNGSEGNQAIFVKEFVESLKTHLKLKLNKERPIHLLDERLSTVAAERNLLEADLSREKRKKVINKMAAVFILQGYLNTRSTSGEFL